MYSNTAAPVIQNPARAEKAKYLWRSVALCGIHPWWLDFTRVFCIVLACAVI
jgi:hypothetical protein